MTDYLKRPPFFFGVFAWSCSSTTNLAFLWAILDSTIVVIDIKNKPPIPINCSAFVGSVSPFKMAPRTNQAVAAPPVAK